MSKELDVVIAMLLLEMELHPLEVATWTRRHRRAAAANERAPNRKRVTIIKI